MIYSRNLVREEANIPKLDIANASLVEKSKKIIMKIMTTPPPPIPATLHIAIKIIKTIIPPISLG